MLPETWLEIFLDSPGFRKDGSKFVPEEISSDMMITNVKRHGPSSKTCGGFSLRNVETEVTGLEAVQSVFVPVTTLDEACSIPR